MGYRTDFVISIADGEASDQDTEKITEMLEAFEGFEYWGGEWMVSDVKWYEYQDDMFKLSKAFPHLRFYVHGDGDDSDDLWEDYWQDGKFQHCYAEIPPYDPSKMQEYHITSS